MQKAAHLSLFDGKPLARNYQLRHLASHFLADVGPEKGAEFVRFAHRIEKYVFIRNEMRGKIWVVPQKMQHFALVELHEAKGLGKVQRLGTQLRREQGDSKNGAGLRRNQTLGTAGYAL